MELEGEEAEGLAVEGEEALEHEGAGVAAAGAGEEDSGELAGFGETIIIAVQRLAKECRPPAECLELSVTYESH